MFFSYKNTGHASVWLKIATDSYTHHEKYMIVEKNLLELGQNK